MDVIIIYHNKDKLTGQLCVDNIRKFLNVRYIYYISASDHLLKNAIHIDESLFPFSKDDIYNELPNNSKTRTGWYLQQLLKLYAYKVIHDITKQFLIVDADIIFLRKIDFITYDNKQLFSYTSEYTPDYFNHLERFFPELKKQFTNKSGVAHHMLFDVNILNNLFNIIEQKHKQLFWKAIISHIDDDTSWHAGFSEYELYFNFIFQYFPSKCKLRKLSILDDDIQLPFMVMLNKSIHKRIDISFDNMIQSCENNSFDFIELHTHTIDTA